MRKLAITGEIDATTVVSVDRLLRRATDVTITVDSVGGCAFAGLQIYVALRRHQGAVTILVDGIAASAASLIAMAADNIVMRPSARLMMHNPSAVAQGSGDDLRATAVLLDRIGSAMVAAYATRSRLPADRVAAMLAAETWLSADQALTLGFADKITAISLTGVAQPVARFAEISGQLIQVVREVRL